MNCAKCGGVIQGAAIVTGDLVSHELCLRTIEAQKKGLTHLCPKCKGVGSFTNILNDCDGGCGFKGCCHEDYKVTRDCDLCTGEGFLAEAPIPVIVDWKKRT